MNFKYFKQTYGENVIEWKTSKAKAALVRVI